MKGLGVVFLLAIGWWFVGMAGASTSTDGLQGTDDIRFHRDSDDALTISKFIEQSQSNAALVDSEIWQKLESTHINFLYDDAAYWFQFPLKHQSDNAKDWVLEIDWPFLDFLDFYLIDSNGHLVYSQQTGDKTLKPESIAYRLPHFKFQLEADSHYTALLRVKTTSSVIVPMAFSPAEEYQAKENAVQAAYGLFFGALLIMALYNIVISVFTRDKSYVFYVAYLLSLTFYAASVTGFGQLYIWGCSPWIQNQGLGLSVALSFLCGAFFVDYFLRLKHSNPFAHMLLKISFGVYGVLAVGSLFLVEKIIVNVEQPVGLIACFAVFVIAWYELRKGNSVARYFLIAWAALLFGTCAYTLLLLGLLPRNEFTENIQMIGIGIEMLLLSMALAERINKHRIEQNAAMKALFETAKQKHEAESDAKARSEFFAKMSHEIRTPIGGVMGIAELLKSTELTKAQIQYVETIYHSGESLLTIVNDILDFSKMDAGKLEIESIPFKLKKLVHECVDIVSVRCDTSKITFDISIGEEVAPWLMGDSIRIRQVLLNFLSNAAKFTDEGTVSICIEQTDFEDADGHAGIHFKIIDQGIGLSKDQAAKLFQPFQQADISTTRRFGGTGLGLAICKELVELMGGKIGVDSEIGKGACFWFTIYLPESENKDILGAPNSKLDSAKSPLSGLYVLVAEDNPVNTIVLKGMLKKLGVNADFVENGVEALSHYQNHHQRYQAVLMDCEMPVMDGFETSDGIRTFEKENSLPSIDIIALTAHSFGDFEAKLKNYGINQYLMKPASETSLYKMLALLVPSL